MGRDLGQHRRATRGRLGLAVFLSCGLAFAAGTADAVETIVVVRAKAKDAMFIGTSMGGAEVVIREADSGRILTQGVTAGGTGDRRGIMEDPQRRGTPLTDARTAKFEGRLDLTEPVLATVEVSAPIGQPQSMVRASTQIWLLPGKSIQGDGVVIEISGFSVGLLAPQPASHVALSGGKATVPITANVMMMCGCPVTSGGLWNADRYEVSTLVKRNGVQVGTLPLSFAGRTSTFSGLLEVTEPGAYELQVYAYDPETGNTGVDKTMFRVGE